MSFEVIFPLGLSFNEIADRSWENDVLTRDTIEFWYILVFAEFIILIPVNAETPVNELIDTFDTMKEGQPSAKMAEEMNEVDIKSVMNVSKTLEESQESKNIPQEDLDEISEIVESSTTRLPVFSAYTP